MKKVVIGRAEIRVIDGRRAVPVIAAGVGTYRPDRFPNLERLLIALKSES